MSFHTGGLLTPSAVHVLTSSCLEGRYPGMPFVDRRGLKRGILSMNMSMIADLINATAHPVSEAYLMLRVQ